MSLAEFSLPKFRNAFGVDRGHWDDVYGDVDVWSMYDNDVELSSKRLGEIEIVTDALYDVVDICSRACPEKRSVRG